MRDQPDDTRHPPTAQLAAQSSLDLRDDTPEVRRESPVQATSGPEEDFLDRVSDASMDSFPASDSPPWMAMRVGPPQ